MKMMTEKGYMRQRRFHVEKQNDKMVGKDHEP